MDAFALGAYHRRLPEQSPLDLFEGSPQAGMFVPPFIDPAVTAQIHDAFCSSKCGWVDPLSVKHRNQTEVVEVDVVSVAELAGDEAAAAAADAEAEGEEVVEEEEKDGTA